jgi:hypothetical protein
MMRGLGGGVMVEACHHTLGPLVRSLQVQVSCETALQTCERRLREGLPSRRAEEANRSGKQMRTGPAQSARQQEMPRGASRHL